jgi:hypothetical protein
MFYNSEFNVKYFDICKELKDKKKKDTNHDYSCEDIDTIINKLYQDELCSVFYAEDILDDKIDIGIRKILKLLKKNKEINYALEELELELFPKDNELKQEYEYLLFMTLFSYNIFYLMHKIICLELNRNPIPQETIDKLKDLVTNVLTNNI